MALAAHNFAKKVTTLRRHSISLANAGVLFFSERMAVIGLS